MTAADGAPTGAAPADKDDVEGDAEEIHAAAAEAASEVCVV